MARKPIEQIYPNCQGVLLQPPGDLWYSNGYRGRSGWKVHTIAPSGAVEVKPYSEYVAKHTPAEIL